MSSGHAAKSREQQGQISQPVSAKRNPDGKFHVLRTLVSADATHTKTRTSIAPAEFLASSGQHRSRGDRDHEMDIRYSDARFDGYPLKSVGICVWLQAPPLSQLLQFDEHDARVLVWISVQISVLTGRWDARAPRSVERKPGGRPWYSRPLALAA
jgi:hypothetical protein